MGDGRRAACLVAVGRDAAFEAALKASYKVRATPERALRRLVPEDEGAAAYIALLVAHRRKRAADGGGAAVASAEQVAEAFDDREIASSLLACLADLLARALGVLHRRHHHAKAILIGHLVHVEDRWRTGEVSLQLRAKVGQSHGRHGVHPVQMNVVVERDLELLQHPGRNKIEHAFCKVRGQPRLDDTELVGQSAE